MPALPLALLLALFAPSIAASTRVLCYGDSLTAGFWAGDLLGCMHAPRTLRAIRDVFRRATTGRSLGPVAKPHCRWSQLPPIRNAAFGAPG